jgi:carotenoid cleavage dioxygenase-like enzyme
MTRSARLRAPDRRVARGFAPRATASFDPLIQRRAFLRGAALLAGGTVLPSFLPGCGSSGEKVVPFEVDASRPWWLQNNYDPVFDELDAFDLAVHGAIPPELDGVYVRNGSNAQKADNTHWFLGDGMLHGIRLRGGRAEWYRNRWIRTEPFVKSTSTIEAGLPQGGNNQSNVSPIYHAGRLLTSGEVGFPYEVDPDDLSTVGVHDFDGALTGGSFTAHAKIDPVTGFLHFFGYWFTPPYLTYHVADATGRLIHSEEIPVARTTMIHSFAITDRDVVFWELPVVFDGRGFEVQGFPFLWSDDVPARVGVMPLGGPASAMRWVEIEPAFVFHELNAFRDGDDVVIDVCRYPRMMDGERFGTYEPHLHRWRVGTGGADLRFRDEVVDASSQFEFPMHDRRLTGRPTRHGWFALPRANPETIDVGGIAHRDYATGVTSRWDPGPNRHCGEALFVPGGDGEGEGWLLTFVYDHARDTSELAILEALDVGAGPVAEVRMPRRVPFGFHGAWIPR